MTQHERILARFREIGVGSCATCIACNATDKRPLLPWHVGRHYAETEPRLVVIGKSHRDDRPTRTLPDGFQDGRATARELHFDAGWPYWSYVRDLLERLHGSAEAGWDCVARTNLIKCTTVTRETGSVDTTSRRMKEACIRDLGAIREELRILQPQRILLMTGTDYDEYAADLAWDASMRFEWIDDPERRLPCGKKLLAAARFRIGFGSRTVEGLRIGHPERMQKAGYVQAVLRWLDTGRVPAVVSP